MQDLVRHLPTGYVINLDDPGDDGWAKLAEIAPPHHNKEGELVCAHGASIYLQYRQGIRHGRHLVGIHFKAGLDDHHLPAPMSDQHKREVESWAIEPSREGYSIEAEKRLNTGSRPDLVLDGRVPIEVQRSKLTAQSAIIRSRKTVGAGLLAPTWSAETPITTVGKRRDPPWAFHVPSIGMGILPWDTVHDPRDVTIVTGLQRIRPTRCDGIIWPSCPTGGRPCGKDHPWHYPVQLTLAELSVRLIQGTILPLRFQFNRTKAIYLTNPWGYDVYHHLIGRGPEPLYLGLEPSAPSAAKPLTVVQHNREWWRGPFIQPPLWGDAT